MVAAAYKALSAFVGAEPVPYAMTVHPVGDYLDPNLHVDCIITLPSGPVNEAALFSVYSAEITKRTQLSNVVNAPDLRYLPTPFYKTLRYSMRPQFRPYNLAYDSVSDTVSYSHPDLDGVLVNPAKKYDGAAAAELIKRIGALNYCTHAKI
ncbi:MAG: hypothetical protein PHH26_01980 [Candidatus Thermoplasmatota archaeon]|nr:hypothetical protein [Candidatus Thermoplasmatota archaeon]